ncbi:IS110 family transposase [Sphingobacterium sp. CZ-2]|uniref:IS110 family transposase n=1 Tax=Sphingobacterium sp. CZ-2 TaxID=2557994 RepID=UPI00106FF12E|nr:IS110 family transposase [Sphingobacterium sp. CZ-2]QBR11283.1 IS110 family transposase [Sphingobacterium sp. CZ-2]QBR11537.1 IS110 family transposase [Sphingobacterium sp. CZ-2]QBR11679.1 IS110 family transposase [Sphingobacterium sp. CZ-2]QBR12683.1 IS110 family transposase [Sphingobacterium sp. CZ-2]
MVTGIDCSKDYFDISVQSGQKEVFKGRFSNDEAGFVEALGHMHGSHIAMEATGPYYFRLAKFLWERDERVSVINPLVIRRFSQMTLARTKTDRKDAQLIAKFTSMTEPAQWRLPEEHVLRIRNLEGYIKGQKECRTMLTNRLHAYEHAGTLEPTLRKTIEEGIKRYDQDINEHERQVQQIIMENYGELNANLRSIPGIGPRSAALLIILTDGFSRFEGHRQLISYFGLAPRIFESGSSVRGKGHICKMGMGQVRKVLYMAAISAIRSNTACSGLYGRLMEKGKPYKVAIIAVVNKLIKQAFAIAKSGKGYIAKAA